MNVIPRMHRSSPMKSAIESREIEDLVSGKNDLEEVHVDGISIPVLRLRKLMEDGYVHLRVYRENRSVSL
jgi:hypothetical protein